MLFIYFSYLQAKKLQEVTLRASAGQRELEIVRGQVKSLKTQLQQMQELLATREQEHRYRQGKGETNSIKPRK